MLILLTEVLLPRVSCLEQEIIFLLLGALLTMISECWALESTFSFHSAELEVPKYSANMFPLLAG